MGRAWKRFLLVSFRIPAFGSKNTPTGETLPECLPWKRFHVRSAPVKTGRRGNVFSTGSLEEENQQNGLTWKRFSGRGDVETFSVPIPQKPWLLGPPNRSGRNAPTWKRFQNVSTSGLSTPNRGDVETFPETFPRRAETHDVETFCKMVGKDA